MFCLGSRPFGVCYGLAVGASKVETGAAMRLLGHRLEGQAVPLEGLSATRKAALSALCVDRGVASVHRLCRRVLGSGG